MLHEEYHREHINSHRRVNIMEERSQSMQARIGELIPEAEEQTEHAHPQVVKALEDTATNHHNS
eukprot:2692613-Prorocentrum_lima.AAC.1